MATKPEGVSKRPFLNHGDDYLRRAMEVTVHVGLLLLFIGACFVILRPFILLTAWGVVVAIAVYPAYTKLRTVLGGRGGWAAVLCTLALLIVLIVPPVLLAGTIVDGMQTLAGHLEKGTSIIPPPPARIATWPIIGSPLNSVWSLASRDMGEAVRRFAPKIQAFVPELLSTSAAIGLKVVQLAIAIVIAGVLLAKARSCTTFTHSFANRLLGQKGAGLVELAGSTIRSVTNGILGVALIQSGLASVGFLVAGIPAAGLWTVLFLVGAVLQIGGLVLIPAIVYLFATASTTKAVIFLVWCIIVGVSDNILKPLLLGRGAQVPMLVIFLGAIGGFMAMGIIGLFAGAIVLSVSHKLFIAWLEEPDSPLGT